MYIDVSFPRPSSAPYLNIQVHRHFNCTGLRSLYYSTSASIARRVTIGGYGISLIGSYGAVSYNQLKVISKAVNKKRKKECISSN